MSNNVKEAVKDKSKARILLGAAFIMAISAVGPGFLTQTARFTAAHGASHGFIILMSLALGIGVQLNVWRIIGVSGMRGQDIGNKVIPYFGWVLMVLIVIGGFAFNIGNVGGAAMGLNALLNVPPNEGYWIACLLAIFVFISKSKTVIDWVMKILGVAMILIVVGVMFRTAPPVGEAAFRTVWPEVGGNIAGITVFFFPIMTYLGGTVGGYITFSGAHRLLDADISGKDNLKKITVSSVQGISIATLMRIVLFLAIFGVIAAGSYIAIEDPNPAATAFRYGAGMIGYRFFGAVLLVAGLTSIIGAAYTSVTFIKTLFKVVDKYENYFVIAMIVISTMIMRVVGSPAQMLVVVGFLNSLILPFTLTTVLLASRRKDIVGEDYKHPLWLTIFGIVIIVTVIVFVIFGGQLMNLINLIVGAMGA